MPGPIADPTDRQHNRHFHEYALNRCQRRSEFGTEQSNGRCRYHFEKVAGPDQRARRRDRMEHTKPLHEPIGQSGIYIDLEQDGHSDQHNMNGPAHDVLGLEGQDEDQCEEQDRDCVRGESR